MQKKAPVLICAATLAGLLFFTACQKGSSGPQGPVGPAGPTGPASNANVLVDTFTLVNTDWLWNSGYVYSNSNGGTVTYFTRYHDVSFSSLTQGILDSGIVMVYIAPDANNPQQYSPMPYVFLSFGSIFYYNYVFETFVGKVRMHFFYTQNSTTAAPTTLSTDIIPIHRYKIVLLTGRVAIDMKTHNVDVRDYNAVSHYLNL